MGLEKAVKFTNDIGAADAILALHSKLKENSWIRGVAKYQRLPIFVMKTNMMADGGDGKGHAYYSWFGDSWCKLF